jgi:class 3 adenylate cyclase
MGDLPSGTVTFLFTDLEGSTRLWEEDADAMRVAVARHDVQLESAITRHAGAVFSRMGDGMAAAFASAPQGIAPA